jgi:hypothetical protein
MRMRIQLLKNQCGNELKLLLRSSICDKKFKFLKHFVFKKKRFICKISYTITWLATIQWGHESTSALRLFPESESAFFRCRSATLLVKGLASQVGPLRRPVALVAYIARWLLLVHLHCRLKPLAAVPVGLIH